VADRGQREELPFDIAANRAIYYENTIARKKKFEDDFRKSIAALETGVPGLLSPWKRRDDASLDLLSVRTSWGLRAFGARVDAAL
jgi:hypothetical protein